MSKLLKAYDRSRVPLYIQVAAVMRQRIERRPVSYTHLTLPTKA